MATIDLPVDTSPVIGGFAEAWAATLSDADVDTFIGPHLPDMGGSAGAPGLEKQRSYRALDWLARTTAPDCLDLAGLSAHATALRGLLQLNSTPRCVAALSALRSAWAAAWSDAAALAPSGAWARLGAQQWALAEQAASRAAVPACFGAASPTFDDPAENACWTAAWAIAWGSMGIAGWSEISLESTVAQLQSSASNLVDQMLV